MSRSKLFCREIKKNESIRPFLVTGVLESDYKGERQNENFCKCVEDAMLDADKKFAKADPRVKELDEITLSGMQGKWQFCSIASPQYAHGHYYLMEKLGLMPIFSVLESPEPQKVKIRINAKRVCGWLNGTLVLDNKDFFSRKTERVYVFEHVVKPNYEEIELNLNKGENRLFILQAVVGRGTGMSFSMELLDCKAPIKASVPLNMPENIREEIAQSQMETYMQDDCYIVGDPPKVHVGYIPMKECIAFIRLLRNEKEIRGEQEIVTSDVELPENLLAGEYTAEVSWKLKDGTLLSKQLLSFHVTEIVKSCPGYNNFGKRREKALGLLSESGDPLALYRLERYGEISVENIREKCEKIERRADCADFELMPLLWLAWEDRYARHLSKEIHTSIRNAAVGFRYWVDEPGDSSMFYCSENHRIGFHVCEYLAGLLYPTDLFHNCGQNGMYHSMKGRMHLVEWLNQRCRFGFDEPHSDTYLPITMSALLVLREVLPMEEYPLRNMVDILLDFMTYIFAVSFFDGVMATPRGRSYNRPLRSPLHSRSSSVAWFFFGNAQCSAQAMFSDLAFSFYVPPKGICELAENFTPATFYFKQGLMHFDKHNADFTIRRTGDYMIGGIRDHNVGMCDMHFIPAMIALKGGISIFFSAPNNVGEGGGLRPDYWAGQAFLPRVLMTGRTLAVIWHDVKDPNIWMTHCHFNSRMFDEVRQQGGWTFGKKGDGYVAIYSSKPHTFSKQGLYAKRELICEGNEAFWIAECGSKKEDGEFEEFIQKILQAACWQDEKGGHFDSPGSGLIEFGLVDGFMVNRVEVPIMEYMAYSPYIESRYGSGRIQYKCSEFADTKWSYPASE